MANTTVDTPVRRRGHLRHDRVEYRFYVALIFVFALPFALVAWLTQGTAPEGAEPRLGPVAAALTESRLLASMVFRA